VTRQRQARADGGHLVCFFVINMIPIIREPQSDGFLFWMRAKGKNDERNDGRLLMVVGWISVPVLGVSECPKMKQYLRDKEESICGWHLSSLFWNKVEEKQ
jgi:hypothetical protein